jgi:hypothetical protein
MPYGSESVPQPRTFAAFAAILGCLALVAGTTLASANTDALTTQAREVNCGNVVGPRWTAKYGPTTGRHYTVAATNVSCATALAYFRRVVGRISPGPGQLGFWRPLPGIACLAPPKGKPFSIGGCTFGARPLLPGPLGAPPPGAAQAKSFGWHLCIATATKNLECKFTYLK